MDTNDQQQRGNFIAYINGDKKPGDNRPMFTGYVSKPGSKDGMEVALWLRRYRDKDTGADKEYYSGNVSASHMDATPKEQIAALARKPDGGDQKVGSIDVKPFQIVLFHNAYKDEAPEKNRPDLWGAINFGDGSPACRLSAWFDKTRSGTTMLAGNASYPRPGLAEPELQDAHEKPEVTGAAKSRGGRKASRGGGDSGPDR